MTGLIRDPADWATDCGWVSRLRAQRAAKRLLNMVEKIDLAFGGEFDEGFEDWKDELRSIADYLAPKETPMERRERMMKRRDVDD